MRTWTNPQRPIVFVPVYFGYEKLIEGQAFISELGGAEKQKESLGGLGPQHQVVTRKILARSG